MKIFAQMALYFGLLLIVQVALRPEPYTSDYFAVASGCALVSLSAYFALCAIENRGEK